jgi:hypothetical protein
VNLNLGRQTGVVFDGQGELSSFDRLYCLPGSVKGSDFDDSLNGTLSAEIFFGGLGNDQLSGGGGNDLLIGGAGDDTLTVSGQGASQLTGGQGADHFVLNLDASGKARIDITDLSSAEEDIVRINLSDISSDIDQYFDSYQFMSTEGHILSQGQTGYLGKDIFDIIVNNDNINIHLYTTDGLAQDDPFLAVSVGQSQLTPNQLLALIEVGYF